MQHRNRIVQDVEVNRMNERNMPRPFDGDGAQAPAHTEMSAVQWRNEAQEMEGWALQWDTSALRRANLARQMRELREASGNP